jgi:hypothetical protein
MNYSCPLCLVDLKHRQLKKVPVEQTSSWFVRRWHLVCPACNGALTANPHAAEKSFFPGAILALVGLNIYSAVTGYKVSMTGSLLMLGLIFAAAYVVRNLIPPKDWPRYMVWQPGKR